jgi:hypothetical protein
MQQLNLLINQLEDKIDFYKSEKTSVSKSTIGWQIDHSLRVFNGIISILKKSDPDNYKWKFNFPRAIVLTFKNIPRGKANAPKNVRTYDEILKQDLINQLEIAKKLVLDLKELNKKSNFIHPYFGVLNLKQSISFIEIHTIHHLKIINDILK